MKSNFTIYATLSMIDWCLLLLSNEIHRFEFEKHVHCQQDQQRWAWSIEWALDLFEVVREEHHEECWQAWLSKQNENEKNHDSIKFQLVVDYEDPKIFYFFSKKKKTIIRIKIIQQKFKIKPQKKIQTKKSKIKSDIFM